MSIIISTSTLLSLVPYGQEENPLCGDTTAFRTEGAELSYSSLCVFYLATSDIVYYCILFLPEIVTLGDSVLDESFVPELCSWINNLGLTVADQKVLKGGGWLSANHMSAFSRLLLEKYPDQNGLRDTCILAQKNEWLSDPEDFVQLINVGGNHWACVSNKFCGAGEVDLYDSLHTVPLATGTIVRQVCTILKSPLKELVINIVNVQCQEGSNDCGLFALALSCDISTGVDPVKRQYNQTEMRDHLQSCFERRQASLAFPSEHRECSRRTVRQVFLELHCLCRLPEMEKVMVCCDVCDVWYHEGCVPVPDTVFLDDSAEWVCCQCKLIYNWFIPLGLITCTVPYR